MQKDHNAELIDLGDAVIETKGTAPFGTIDQVSGKKSTGFSYDD